MQQEIGSGGVRAVLVTGASSGIGRTITRCLSGAGHHVYAGARKESDLDALDSIDNVTAIRLDVTNQDDIAAAVDTVRRGGRGLFGLVNNAGIATVGLVTEGDVREFQLTFAVNAFAPYFVTRAFAPLICASRGRIVMIGSIAGVLAEPYLCAYSMSKHALEALTDVLAAEMTPFDVQVSIVEPGGFRTQLLENAAQRLCDRSLHSLAACPEPDAVAIATTAALFAARPKRRYLVVGNEDEARKTITKQIEQLAQLNCDHAYAYKRETLIAMLDAAAERLRPNTEVG